MCNVLELEDGCTSPLQRGVRRAMWKLKQSHDKGDGLHLTQLQEFMRRVTCAIADIAPLSAAALVEGDETQLKRERDEAIEAMSALADEGERLRNEMALNKRELVRI